MAIDLFLPVNFASSSSNLSTYLPTLETNVDYIVFDTSSFSLPIKLGSWRGINAFALYLS